MSVYIDELETEFLPLNCNWIASNLLPKFDEMKNIFVEPYLPNHKIGIMHLASKIKGDNSKMKNLDETYFEFRTLTNNIIKRNIRFVE